MDLQLAQLRCFPWTKEIATQNQLIMSPMNTLNGGPLDLSTSLRVCPSLTLMICIAVDKEDAPDTVKNTITVKDDAIRDGHASSV